VYANCQGKSIVFRVLGIYNFDGNHREWRVNKKKSINDSEEKLSVL
jgi:hypothetical protein